MIPRKLHIIWHFCSDSLSSRNIENANSLCRLLGQLGHRTSKSKIDTELLFRGRLKHVFFKKLPQRRVSWLWRSLAPLASHLCFEMVKELHLSWRKQRNDTESKRWKQMRLLPWSSLCCAARRPPWDAKEELNTGVSGGPKENQDWPWFLSLLFHKARALLSNCELSHCYCYTAKLKFSPKSHLLRTSKSGGFAGFLTLKGLSKLSSQATIEGSKPGSSYPSPHLQSLRMSSRTVFGLWGKKTWVCAWLEKQKKHHPKQPLSDAF